jgi:hypothetical protein
MQSNIRQIIQGIIAIIVLALFAWLYGDAVIRTLGATSAVPEFSEGHSIVAAGTAGLIGAIVASRLGQSGGDRMERLGQFALPSTPEVWHNAIGWIYVGIYGALGLSGIIAWVLKSGSGLEPNLVPDLVKNLATAVLALFLGVVASAYSDGTPAPSTT